MEAAMEDDSMVVEMLLGLSQTTAESKAALPLEWRVRQRRSKPVTVSAKKAAPRDSPNTPLSWSGGTSGSGGAVDGGPEESSRPPSGSKPARSARSKVRVFDSLSLSQIFCLLVAVVVVCACDFFFLIFLSVRWMWGGFRSPAIGCSFSLSYKSRVIRDDESTPAKLGYFPCIAHWQLISADDV